MGKKIKFEINPRYGICAPEGFVIVSLDYSGQELMLAAALSEDPILLTSFRSPEKLPGPDGKLYYNPDADLHTLTTKACCFPEIYKDDKGEDLPWWRWRDIGDTTGCRKFGKIKNFGAIFGQSAKAVSELNYVPLERAIEWDKNHKQLWNVYFNWAEEVGHLGAARGWIETPWLGRIRCVSESNAKGSGESAEILACNHKIQGSAADMTKVASIRCQNYIRNPKNQRDMPELKDVKLLGVVHDELLFMGPGSCYLDIENSKFKNDICIKPKWVSGPTPWVEPLRQIMIDSETEALNGILTGRVGDAEPCRYWSH